MGPRPPSLRAERSPAAGFLVTGVGFLALAAVLSLAGRLWHWPWAEIAGVHLALIGGVSQLVLGAAQSFAAALLATVPPGRRLIATQRSLWPLGTGLVVVGMAGGYRAAVVAGGGLLAAALVLFAAGLRAMERRSLQRPRWGIRWYYACVAFLGSGGVLGLELARGASWAPGDLLSAHVVLTVLGWLGTAIVGSLHTLFPTLSGRRLAFARLEGPTFACWTLGAASLATGYLLSAAPLAATGAARAERGGDDAAGQRARTARSAGPPLSITARLVLAGQLCLGTGMPLAAGLAPFDPSQPFTGGVRAGLAALLLAGWVGLTVSGSLLHLIPVSLRRPASTLPWPLRLDWVQRAIPVGALCGVALLAAAQLSGAPAGVAAAQVALGASALVLGAAILRLIASSRR